MGVPQAYIVMSRRTSPDLIAGVTEIRVRCGDKAHEGLAAEGVLHGQVGRPRLGHDAEVLVRRTVFSVSTPKFRPDNLSHA